MQKKAYEAEKTVNQILAIDSLNGNAHISKMIIKIYRFKLTKQKLQGNKTNTINWGKELPLAQGIKFEL